MRKAIVFCTLLLGKMALLQAAPRSNFTEVKQYNGKTLTIAQKLAEEMNVAGVVITTPEKIISDLESVASFQVLNIEGYTQPFNSYLNYQGENLFIQHQVEKKLSRPEPTLVVLGTPFQGKHLGFLHHELAQKTHVSRVSFLSIEELLEMSSLKKADQEFPWAKNQRIILAPAHKINDLRTSLLIKLASSTEVKVSQMQHLVFEGDPDVSYRMTEMSVLAKTLSLQDKMHFTLFKSLNPKKVTGYAASELEKSQIIKISGKDKVTFINFEPEKSPFLTKKAEINAHEHQNYLSLESHLFLNVVDVKSAEIIKDLNQYIAAGEQLVARMKQKLMHDDENFTAQKKVALHSLEKLRADSLRFFEVLITSPLNGDVEIFAKILNGLEEKLKTSRENALAQLKKLDETMDSVFEVNLSANHSYDRELKEFKELEIFRNRQSLLQNRMKDFLSFTDPNMKNRTLESYYGRRWVVQPSLLRETVNQHPISSAITHSVGALFSSYKKEFLGQNPVKEFFFAPLVEAMKDTPDTGNYVSILMQLAEQESLVTQEKLPENFLRKIESQGVDVTLSQLNDMVERHPEVRDILSAKVRIRPY